MKAFLKIWMFFVILCFGLTASYAQVRLFSGASYTGVRNDVLKNEEPIFSWYAGGGVIYTPREWKQFSLGLNGMVSRKGYKQYADEWYTFHFDYFSFQPVLTYSPVKLLSFEAGVDLATLINTSVKEGMSTYNQFDCGLIFGFTVFNDKQFALYSQIIYGLTPMLTYNKMDSMGNFTGEINDLKNTSVLFGIRVNVYHGKIPH